LDGARGGGRYGWNKVFLSITRAWAGRYNLFEIEKMGKAEAAAPPRGMGKLPRNRALPPGIPMSFALPGHCRLKAAFLARGGTGRMRPVHGAHLRFFRMGMCSKALRIIEN
jgi:hypothetical protein